MDIEELLAKIKERFPTMLIKELCETNDFYFPILLTSEQTIPIWGCIPILDKKTLKWSSKRPGKDFHNSKRIWEDKSIIELD